MKLIVYGLILVCLIFETGCDRKGDASKPATSASKEEKPKGQLLVDIQGVWSVAPSMDRGTFYLITYDPNSGKGIIKVEESGKIVVEHKFCVTNTDEIRLTTAKREKPYVFSGDMVNTDKLRDVFRLNDPPQTLRFSSTATATDSSKTKPRKIMLLGLLTFGQGDEPLLLEEMTETDRTILPFESVVAEYHLSIPPHVRKVSPDMDPAHGTSDKIIHPKGTINNLEINGNILVLKNSEVKDGFLHSRDFGAFEIVMLSDGSHPAILATRSQINQMARWLDMLDKNAHQLIQAAKDGNLQAVQTALSEGADSNTKDKDGVAVLIWAANNNHMEVVKYLLEKGADVNSKHTTGITALWMAAQEGHMEVAKYLLEKGAEINAKHTTGVTALWEAAWKGHVEVVKLLLEKGADVNAKSNDGKTALQITKEMGHTDIMKLLEKSGAKE